MGKPYGVSRSKPSSVSKNRMTNSKRSSRDSKAPTEEIVFDFTEREKFLTGFHKRKLERQKAARDKAIEKEKEERRQERQALREERKQALVQHVSAVNEFIAKAQGRPYGFEDDSDTSSDTDKPANAETEKGRTKGSKDKKSVEKVSRLSSSKSTSKPDSGRKASKSKKQDDDLPPWLSGLDSDDDKANRSEESDVDEDEDDDDEEETGRQKVATVVASRTVYRDGDDSGGGEDEDDDDDDEKMTTVTIQTLDFAQQDDSDPELEERNRQKAADGAVAKVELDRIAARKEKQRAYKKIQKSKKRRIPYISKAERAVERTKKIQRRISKSNKKGKSKS